MQIDYSGITVHDPGRSTLGYVLFAPVQSSQALLVDYEGNVCHRWAVHGKCTNWCYLLPNGNLFMNDACAYPVRCWSDAGIFARRQCRLGT